MIKCDKRITGGIYDGKLIEGEIKRLQTNAKYEFYKQYLYDEVFTFPENVIHEEVKVAYLNINGLLHAQHIDSLRADFNLLAADIICIAETKLSPDVQDDRLVLEGFDKPHRFDIRHNSMGMNVYIKTGTSANIAQNYAYNDDNVQLVQYTVNDELLSFIYIHPEHVRTGMAKLEQMLRAGEIVLGDLNIDVMDNDKRRILSSFCSHNHLRISEIGPTHGNSAIDHILITDTIQKLHVVESYMNFYSDHKSIAIRFSEIADDKL